MLARSSRSPRLSSGGEHLVGPLRSTSAAVVRSRAADRPAVAGERVTEDYGPEGLLAPPAAASQTQSTALRRRPGGSPASFIKQRRSIAERPAEVEGRETSGHWEADFMLFARYGQGLLVLHERQTRFSIVLHPLDRKAVLTARTIARQLGKLPQTLRKTISFDNGTEFAEHHRLHNAIGVQTFFCDPHSPWQKGGVENSIGRLRRSLPRKTDLNSITAAALRRLAQRNDTPRKCLDFKTPAEAFSKLKSIVALQT